MKIQFIYVQKKENLEEFVFIFKKKDCIDIQARTEESSNLNKIIYSILYNDRLNTSVDINYIKLFYIKKGMTIDFNKEIWNKLLNLNYRNLDILKLIDVDYLLSINSTSCLHFNYKKNQNEINDIIIESFMIDKY